MPDIGQGREVFACKEISMHEVIPGLIFMWLNTPLTQQLSQSMKLWISSIFQDIWIIKFLRILIPEIIPKGIQMG